MSLLQEAFQIHPQGSQLPVLFSWVSSVSFYPLYPRKSENVRLLRAEMEGLWLLGMMAMDIPADLGQLEGRIC